MISFIFFVGILNLSLGFSVAVYLKRSQMNFAIATPAKLKKVFVSEDSSSEKNDSDVFVAEIPRDPVMEDIPEEWLETLEKESIIAGSFVEATVQVLRLEVGKYREALIAIEDQIRECTQSEDKEKTTQLLEELKVLNVDWLEKQNSAASHLESRSDSLGDFSEMGGGLESVLMEQAAQIETTVSNLELLDFSSDINAGCERLIEEIGRLVDLAHNLRDHMHESLMTIMKADNKLAGLDRKMQYDGLTTLHNRSGLEVLFDEWWKDDIVRERTVSVVMIDIDQFAKLNVTHGTRFGDKLLAAFGPFLKELIVKDTGFDVAARYASECFVLFLGDTGPRGATGTVERVRQAIAETTFEYDDLEIELTISCGVTEVQPADDTTRLFKRVRLALRAAKKNDRNCTFIDEGDGPNSVEPPEFQVKGRVVRVRDI